MTNLHSPAIASDCHSSPDSSETQSLWAALQDVTDPEFPVSVVDMGLVYGLKREGETVWVRLTFTAMGCPCMHFIVDDIRARLLQEPGVANVEMEIVWDPPWTKNQLTEEGKKRLQRLGMVV